MLSKDECRFKMSVDVCVDVSVDLRQKIEFL